MQSLTSYISYEYMLNIQMQKKIHEKNTNQSFEELYWTIFLTAIKICSTYNWKNGCAFTVSIWHAVGVIKHLELWSYLRKINWISAKPLNFVMAIFKDNPT